MPFICVQSTPCSGNPADTPLKADGPAGTGRKLQAGHCPGTSHIGGGSPRKVAGGSPTLSVQGTGHSGGWSSPQWPRMSSSDETNGSELRAGPKEPEVKQGHQESS